MIYCEYSLESLYVLIRIVVCTHYNPIDEAILMRTHNIPSCKKNQVDIPIMSPDLAL